MNIDELIEKYKKQSFFDKQSYAQYMDKDKTLYETVREIYRVLSLRDLEILQDIEQLKGTK